MSELADRQIMNKCHTHHDLANKYQYMQITPYYAPAWGFGGPVRLMFEYARWMADKGFRTFIITGDVSHDYQRIIPKSETLYGVHIIRVRVYLRRLVRKSIVLLSPAMLVLAIWRVLRARCKVVVHICEVRGLTPLYGVSVKILFPKKVVLVHSAFGMLHYKKSKRRQIYDRIFLRPLLRCMDLALAQNEHEVKQYRDYLLRYGVNENHRIVLFPLHAGTREIESDSSGKAVELDRAILRKKYSIPKSAFVLIFLGRLHPSKGILRAIDAFLQFSKGYVGRSIFLIVGRDDGMQQKISDVIKASDATSSIRIVNDIYDERFEYYALADLFVGFPTIEEETMLASVEALSCGTPILVSREADIPFVEQGGAGFVIDFSVEEAADRISRVANQPPLFRCRAISMANRYFSESAARHKFIELIKNKPDLTNGA